MNRVWPESALEYGNSKLALLSLGGVVRVSFELISEINESLYCLPKKNLYPKDLGTRFLTCLDHKTGWPRPVARVTQIKISNRLGARLGAAAFLRRKVASRSRRSGW